MLKATDKVHIETDTAKKLTKTFSISKTEHESVLTIIVLI